MILLNSGCGSSAQNHKSSPERQFLITMTNSAEAFKENEQSRGEQDMGTSPLLPNPSPTHTQTHTP